MNHTAAHKHYSYESWLRIWNPELFHILTRGPCRGSKQRSFRETAFPVVGVLAGGDGVIGHVQEISAPLWVATSHAIMAHGCLTTRVRAVILPAMICSCCAAMVAPEKGERAMTQGEEVCRGVTGWGGCTEGQKCQRPWSSADRTWHLCALATSRARGMAKGRGWNSREIWRSSASTFVRQRRQPCGNRGHQWGGALPAWWPRPGHALPFDAFRWTRGGLPCGRRGKQIWAISRPISIMGQKWRLVYSAHSTFLV